MEFVRDFFSTNIMNHCEFLKFLMKLDVNDEVLLIPLLEWMSCGKPLRRIKPFYPGHTDGEKNPLHITMAYTLLKPLKNHEFNIFEASFLDSERMSIKLTAISTLALQWLIFFILIKTSLAKLDEVSNDPIVWLITVCTTFFFSKKCFQQYESADDFRKAFSVLGQRATIRAHFMNVFGNQVLSVLVPVFNFYFMLLSGDANDAILNGLALYFVLELDEMAMPMNWDEQRLLDELAINAHDFIMEPLAAGVLDVEKEGDLTFQNYDKVYVSITGFNVTVYKRTSSTDYDHVTYSISGTEAENFMRHISNFRCFVAYRDIHD